MRSEPVVALCLLIALAGCQSAPPPAPDYDSQFTTLSLQLEALAARLPNATPDEKITTIRFACFGCPYGWIGWVFDGTQRYHAQASAEGIINWTGLQVRNTTTLVEVSAEVVSPANHVFVRMDPIGAWTSGIRVGGEEFSRTPSAFVTLLSGDVVVWAAGSSNGAPIDVFR